MSFFCRRLNIFGLYVAALFCVAPAFVVAEIAPQVISFLDNSPEPLPVSPRSMEMNESNEEQLSSEQVIITIQEELITRGFQNVNVALNDADGELAVSLSNRRISNTDRAIGRAARIINEYAPIKYNQLVICHEQRISANKVCYEIDRLRLVRYFNRILSRWQLRHYINRVDYDQVMLVFRDQKDEENTSLFALASSEKPRVVPARADHEMTDFSLLTGYTLSQNNHWSLQFNPLDFGRYLNDINGDVFVDLQSSLALDMYFGEGFMVGASVFYRWLEPSNPEASNSQLQPVRSGLDLYRSYDKPKIEEFYIGYSAGIGSDKQFNATVGYQEEMFAGLSTQLYWTDLIEGLDLDVRFDWLRQRKIDNPYAFEDYEVVSALLGFRYSGLPYLNDVALYGGRFLAKDEGFRFEAGHRFSNGIRLSFWYSHTDGDDEQSPGSPDSPYRGRGLSVTVPMGLFMKKDTNKRVNFEHLPHVRDTAQMLNRPNDLSQITSVRRANGSVLKGFGQ